MLHENYQEWLVDCCECVLVLLILLVRVDSLLIPRPHLLDHPRIGLMLSDQLHLKVLLDEDLITQAIDYIALPLSMISEVFLHLASEALR